jgi:hypothetical protein
MSAGTAGGFTFGSRHSGLRLNLQMGDNHRTTHMLRLAALWAGWTPITRYGPMMRLAASKMRPLVQHLHNDTLAKVEALGRRVGELYMQRHPLGC